MTKEELIRILYKQKMYEVDERGRLIEYSKDRTNPSRIYIDLFNLVMDLGDISVDGITTRPELRWIPCCERLPDKEGKYLVTDIKTVDMDIFTHSESGTPMWFLSDNVTAWMPQPQPYREDGEQDEDN